MNSRTQSLGLVAALMIGASGSTALGGIVPPPWDPTLPMQTLQAWMFEPGNDPFAPTVANNPNGAPQFFPPTSGTYLPDNPLTPNNPGTGVWCLTGNTTLEFLIPNYNQQFRKEIFISIKYSVPSAGVGVPTAGVTGLSGTPGSPSGFTYTPEPVSPGVSMIHYHQSLPTCESFMVSISFPIGIPGSVGYVEQVVVQTVCVPAPGGAAVAGLGILAASRRRRH